MFYTSMTRAAMKLAYEAHEGQLDRSGVPYIFHPIHLAEQMETEEEMCVALLHDVMEDTDYTEDDIRAAGMSEKVVEALLLMTHDPGADYLDYVVAMKDNPIARKVKIADLKHNSDLTRLEKVTAKDLERAKKYEKARDILGAAS